MHNASRRDILTAVLGLTAAQAIPVLPSTRSAMAQTAPQTAAGIVAAIREKRMTATDTVKAALARADQMKHLNAIITLNSDGALAAAKKIDDMIAAGQPLPPLAGLPIVVKDNINTADMPTTGGTEALRNARPKANAPTLQKLIDAGAIPGGSSGGTAAAIAAGIVAADLGTDTGGSTRIPAALTGIVGLRPSVGNGGAERRYHDANAVVPISRTRDTIGPMGRTVADVALLDAVVTGTPVATPVALKGKRIGIPLSFWTGLDPELEAVAKAARGKLETAGVVFVDGDLPGLAELNAKVSFPVALHEPVEDIPAYLKASGIDGVTLADIAGKIKSPDVQGAFGAILKDAFGKDYPDAMKVHRPALQKLYADYFKANNLDAMLFPTTPAPAVPIDAEKGSGEMSIAGGKPAPTFFTMIRNTDPGSNAGIPGLSLFAGLTKGGLPVGIELDGPVGSDRALLALGLAMEALLGTAPPPAGK